MAQPPMDENALIEEAFNLYDRDGKGFITPDLLGTVLRSIGKIPSEREVQLMANQASQEHQGRITLDLLKQLAARTRAHVTEDQVNAAYAVFDREGKGFILVKEFRHILTTVGERLTEGEVDRMLEQAKAGQEGRISKAQFMAMMQGRF